MSFKAFEPSSRRNRLYDLYTSWNALMDLIRSIRHWKTRELEIDTVGILSLHLPTCRHKVPSSRRAVAPWEQGWRQYFLGWWSSRPFHVPRKLDGCNFNGKVWSRKHWKTQSDLRCFSTVRFHDDTHHRKWSVVSTDTFWINNHAVY